MVLGGVRWWRENLRGEVRWIEDLAARLRVIVVKQC